MTHVLISIEEIELSLQRLRQALNFANSDTALHPKDVELATELQNEIATREWVLKYGKQVALDEQSIDERIKAERPPLTFIAGEYHGLEKSQGFSRGYKKAIKDLL